MYPKIVSEISAEITEKQTKKGSRSILSQDFWSLWFEFKSVISEFSIALPLSGLGSRLLSAALCFFALTDVSRILSTDFM